MAAALLKPTRGRVLLLSGVASCTGAGLLLRLAGGASPTAPGPTAPHPVSPPADAGVAAIRPASHTDGRLRVGLTRLSGRAALTVRSIGAGSIWNISTGRREGRISSGQQISAAVVPDTGEVCLRAPGITARGSELKLVADRIRAGRGTYPAALRFRASGSGLEVVNELEIEQYLEGVLPGELPARFGIEAQKALAVAARTYALVQRGKHGSFDLCDRTCCQMYLGTRSGSPRALAAVRATRHLCLWSGKELVYAFYSADCGGATARLEDVPLRDKPDGSRPYLQVVQDRRATGGDYCAQSPYHRWSVNLSPQRLERELNDDPETEIGRLEVLEVKDHDPSGRVTDVRLRGKLPLPNPEPGPGGWLTVEKQVTGWSVRRAVGPFVLRSTLMDVARTADGAYRFTGRGFGHGLGLCQIGADARAAAGESFRQILTAYYPSAQVRPLTR